MECQGLMISPLLNISGIAIVQFQFQGGFWGPIGIIKLEIGGLSTIIGHVQVGQTMAIWSKIVSADEKGGVWQKD